MKIINFFYSSLKGLLFWVSSILLGFVFSSSLLLCYPIIDIFFNKKKNALLAVFPRLWAKSIFFINRSWNIKTIGLNNLKLNEPVMYVANHQSQCDIMLIHTLPVHFCWLSKKSVFYIPIFGWAMAACGYVGIDRSNKNHRMLVIKKSIEKLEQGTSMFFFPEGTRSDSGQIKEFKLGAFKVAAEARVPIIPISIVGTHDMLPKNKILPSAANLKIIVHPSISSDNKTPKELMEECQIIIANSLKK